MKDLRCPGYYCGRIELPDGNWSECGSCPRGSRVNESFVCTLCEDELTFYDWLYLVFVVALPFVFHCHYIEVVMRMQKIVKQLYLSAFLEIFISSLCTLLLVDPIGTFKVRSCRVSWLSDWYTLLYNPAPNYEDPIYCTQEAVYPLYSMVFIFYMINIVLLLCIRPWFVKMAHDSSIAVRTLYAGLYLFPVLAFIHATLGGLIYYSFPYIALIVSMVINAIHLTSFVDQTPLKLIKSAVSNIRSIIIVWGIWMSNMFAVVGITQLSDPLTDYLLLGTAPLPTIFYILTSPFTDPHKIHND